MVAEVEVDPILMQDVSAFIAKEDALGYSDASDFVQDAVRRFIRLKKYGPPVNCLQIGR